MTTITTLRQVLLLITALAFSSMACQKATDGAVGPQGATGATGAAGPGGATGPKGDPGTANVIYSAWTDVAFAGSGTSYLGTITATKITQEVLDKADIRV